MTEFDNHDAFERYKAAIGGAGKFLLKDEGGWYKGEDGGVWVKVTRKQAATAATQGGEFLPADVKAGDFARTHVVPDGGFAATERAKPPYEVKRKAEVFIN